MSRGHDNTKYNMILNEVRENTFFNNENDMTCYKIIYSKTYMYNITLPHGAN
jgi:hypothetical protein